MRIVFRLKNTVVDNERIAALNKELAYLASHGWTLERHVWIGNTALELQLRAIGDEERLKRLLDAMLRAGKAGWEMYGELSAASGLAGGFGAKS